MRLEEEQKGSIRIVRVMDKRIDASSAASFKEKMTEIITGGARRVVLDLAAVDFIDSTGLGAIVSALKVIGQGGELAIAGTQETVLSLFRLTRMNRVFQMFASEEEALAALAKE